MKKKRLCSLMLSLVMITSCAIGSNTLTVKAWKQTDHQASVQKLSSHALFSSKINYSLVEKAAGYTDTKYGPVKSDNWVRKANGLHGVGNYVANLKYLYGVVWRYIYAKDSDPRGYFEEKSWVTRTDGFGVDASLIKAVGDEADLESTRKGKASRILGLAVHLTGDIYAHRVIVPTSTISGAGYSASGNKLGTSDFTDYCTVEHTDSDISLFVHTFEDEYNYDNVNNMVCHNWSCVCKAINAGLLETMDIKYFTTVKDGSKYEDNITYYPSRFNTATNWTLKHVFDGLNAKTTNIGRSYILSKDEAYNTTAFTAQLSDFSNYCTCAGGLNE